MAKAYLFFNPYAGDGHGKDQAILLSKTLSEECILCDMTKPETYEQSLFEPQKEDAIILCGGDGTLHHFINLVEDIEIKCDILYYPCGIQNDFAKNLGKENAATPFSIKKELQNLPYVEVKNRKHRFLCGIGCGLDSSCLATFTELKKSGEILPSYPSFVKKNIFKNYEPIDVVVTVDGTVHSFHKVWCVPTVKGRFYRGGTLPDSCDGSLLSVVIIHESGKWKTWNVIHSMMKGKEKPDTVEILSGREISVELSKPQILSMDGEILRNISSYKAVLA